jgi:hypothetical protein
VDLKAQLGLTLVIIEHDIPLIMGISDRIIAMADGSVIAEGAPDVVQSDPGVVDAYLGGSITAIERSGAGRPRPARTPATVSAPLDDVLASVRGLGSARRAQLLAAFPGDGALEAASVQDLQQVPGVGPALATRIRTALDAALTAR